MLQTIRPDSGFLIVPNWPKIQKMTMPSQFVDMNSWLNFFWCCRVSFLKLSYWSKFHVNIVTGSIFMTIFLYKELTRNPEIGNTLVCILPNIWRLGLLRDTRFGKNVTNEILLNAVKSQGYSFYRFWVIKGGWKNYSNRVW